MRELEPLIRLTLFLLVFAVMAVWELRDPRPQRNCGWSDGPAILAS
jgi:hypothetical protein